MVTIRVCAKRQKIHKRSQMLGEELILIYLIYVRSISVVVLISSAMIPTRNEPPERRNHYDWIMSVIHSFGIKGEERGELDRTISLRLGELEGESIPALGEVVYPFLGGRNIDGGLGREDELPREFCLGG